MIIDGSMDTALVEVGDAELVELSLKEEDVEVKELVLDAELYDKLLIELTSVGIALEEEELDETVEVPEKDELLENIELKRGSRFHRYLKILAELGLRK